MRPSNRKHRADSRTHKFVAADGSRRTFPQLLRSSLTPVGGYDFLNPSCLKRSFAHLGLMRTPCAGKLAHLAHLAQGIEINATR